MRVAVLASPESWYLSDLRRAAGDRHEVIPATFRQLSSSVESAIDRAAQAVSARSGEIDLQQGTFDAVLVRTMPPGTLEQVVFRMDVLGQLEAAGQVVINPPRSIEAAVDKYLATARLRAAGLPVPRTIACQTPDDALAAFHALGGDVVLKPLFGAEGRGIARLTDEALADRAFRMLCQLGAVVYLQEFIPHDGYDLRVFAVGPKLFAMRRHNEHDWRTNVSRGATTEAADLTDETAGLARTAAAAIGAPLAGVDLLPSPDGGWYVLEVNAVPGWQALGRTLNIDVASLVLEEVQRIVLGER